MGDVSVVPTILAGSLGTLLVVYTVRKWMACTNSVPGPTGWPILGYMPYLLPSKMHRTMEQLISQYGPILKLQLGSWDAVFLTNYHHIKKAFQSAEFSFRPSIFLFELVAHGNHGLASSGGELWAEQRRFALRHLRDLGMGRSSIEVHIQREALDMVESLKETIGQPIDFSYNLNIAITNIVWALVAGQRMAHDDPVFTGFMAAVNRNIKLGTRMGIVGFVPWVMSILPRSWLGINLIEDSMANIENYFKNIIEEHKKTFNPNDLRDYTDHFIAEQRRQGESSTFTDMQLVVSMGDLFVAGGETTATTLRWAILLLSYFPEIQKKMQDEIDEIVGRNQFPTLIDRERMPYTEAVIHEVQRYADIVPMGLFHANRNETRFEGFTIPKDSIVVGYMGACHRSSKYWARPNEFYPEHFLDEEGHIKKNVEGFLPFSIGRRQCIGENLARVELFTFITYFFQSFNFTLCQSDAKPSLKPDPNSGLVFWPHPYKVVLQLR